MTAHIFLVQRVNIKIFTEIEREVLVLVDLNIYRHHVMVLRLLRQRKDSSRGRVEDNTINRSLALGYNLFFNLSEGRLLM